MTGDIDGLNPPEQPHRPPQRPVVEPRDLGVDRHPLAGEPAVARHPDERPADLRGELLVQLADPRRLAVCDLAQPATSGRERRSEQRGPHGIGRRPTTSSAAWRSSSSPAYQAVARMRPTSSRVAGGSRSGPSPKPLCSSPSTCSVCSGHSTRTQNQRIALRLRDQVLVLERRQPLGSGREQLVAVPTNSAARFFALADAPTGSSVSCQSVTTISRHWASVSRSTPSGGPALITCRVAKYS